MVGDEAGRIGVAARSRAQHEAIRRDLGVAAARGVDPDRADGDDAEPSWVIRRHQRRLGAPHVCLRGEGPVRRVLQQDSLTPGGVRPIDLMVAPSSARTTALSSIARAAASPPTLTAASVGPDATCARDVVASARSIGEPSDVPTNRRASQPATRHQLPRGLDIGVPLLDRAPLVMPPQTVLVTAQWLAPMAAIRPADAGQPPRRDCVGLQRRSRQRVARRVGCCRSPGLS